MSSPVSNQVSEANADSPHPSEVVTVVLSSVSIPSDGNARGSAKKLEGFRSRALDQYSSVATLIGIFQEVELVRLVHRASWTGIFSGRNLIAGVACTDTGKNVTASTIDNELHYVQLDVASPLRSQAVHAIDISQFGPYLVVAGTRAYGKPLQIVTSTSASGPLGKANEGRFESKLRVSLRVSRPRSRIPASVSTSALGNADRPVPALTVSLLEPWVKLDSENPGPDLITGNPISFGQFPTLALLFQVIELKALSLRFSWGGGFVGSTITAQLAISPAGTTITSANIDEQVNFWQINVANAYASSPEFDVPMADLLDSMILNGTPSFGSKVQFSVRLQATHSPVDSDLLEAKFVQTVALSRPR